MDKSLNTLLEPVAALVSSLVFFSVPVAGAEVPLMIVWLAAGAL